MSDVVSGQLGSHSKLSNTLFTVCLCMHATCWCLFLLLGVVECERLLLPLHVEACEENETAECCKVPGIGFVDGRPNVTLDPERSLCLVRCCSAGKEPFVEIAWQNFEDRSGELCSTPLRAVSLTLFLSLDCL